MFSFFSASWAVHVKCSQEKMQKGHSSTTAIFLFSHHLWPVEGLFLENPSLSVPPVCSQPLWSSMDNAGWRQLTSQGHHHVPPTFLESLRVPSWFPAHTQCGMSHTTWVLSTSRRGISKALQKLHEVPKLRCLHLEANPNRCPMIRAGNLYWFWLGWS